MLMKPLQKLLIRPSELRVPQYSTPSFPGKPLVGLALKSQRIGSEPRIFLIIVRADGAAHDDQEIKRLRIRQFGHIKESRDRELVAITLQPRFDATQPLKGNML